MYSKNLSMQNRRDALCESFPIFMLECDIWLLISIDVK